MHLPARRFSSAVELERYAKHCGVSASLRGLMSGAASGLLGHVDPGRIVEALVSADNAEGALGEFTLHYFSFGGLVPTARYAHDKTADLAARRSAKCRAMTGSN